METFIDKIATKTTLNPTGATNVRAYVNESDNLVIDAVDGGDLTIAVANELEGTTVNTVNDLFGTPIGRGLTTSGVILAFNPTRVTFAKPFDELLTQIDQLGKDTGF